jgi:hypothetical protein
VILENEPKPKPELEDLIAASDAAEEYPAEGTVKPCPYSHPPPELKPPVRAILWHIREFGGGFQSPAIRPDYCIQAYALIIQSVKADICVLLGLTRTTGWIPESDGGIMIMREESRDSGLAEARRLLVELQRIDAGGGWQLLSVNGADGKPAYHRHETACFLFKTAAGIACGPASVAPCGEAFLALAPMRIPGSFDAPADLPFLAPLRVGRYPFSRNEPPDPAATATLPPNAIVAFSAGQEIPANSGYLDFRTECDVEYVRPLQEGTVLKLPFWEEVAASEEALLENHIALNPADVQLQDRAMYWEALRLADHPDELPDVRGRLSDSLLVRNTGDGPAPRLEKLRVVDLVRASLATAALPDVNADGALDEDAAAAAACAAFVKSLPVVEDASPESPQRLLAEAALFARKLSDHWPVITDVYTARQE